jgi:predicted DNA-binding protein with PD1-like motif
MLVKIFLVFMLLSSIAKSSSPITHVLRLKPGQDVLKEIEQYVVKKNIHAGALVAAVGSLKEGKLRYANQKEHSKISGPLEVVSLSGTISTSGMHLHLAVSDGKGQTTGGHLVEGCEVFTTLEIVIAEYPDLKFEREMDKASGFKELSVKPKTP